jgi:hypothetical protein
MIPPDRDDAERHIMPGPPWVRPIRSRDGARDAEDRNAEDEVSEPVRLDRSFRPLRSRARPQDQDVEDRHDFPESGSSRADRRHHDGGLPTLEPVVMPPPPPEKMRWPSLGITIKLGGAVLVAACAALAMMNAVQIPATGIAASVDSGGQSSATPVFGGLTEIASAQAKALATSEPPSQMIDAFVAATSSNTIAAAQPPATSPRTSAGETSARAATTHRETPQREASLGDAPLRQMPERGASVGEGVPRPETVTRAVAPPDERRVVAPMPPDEMSSLLKRARALMAAGDIASARLILTRLAEGGSVDACLVLAGTFDAAVLADMHVVGVQPDPAKARAWYLKAAEQGSPEARRRLQQSSVR